MKALVLCYDALDRRWLPEMPMLSNLLAVTAMLNTRTPYLSTPVIWPALFSGATVEEVERRAHSSFQKPDGSFYGWADMPGQDWLWDRWNASGLSVGVYHIPVATYPARSLNGWMASGCTTPMTSWSETNDLRSIVIKHLPDDGWKTIARFADPRDITEDTLRARREWLRVTTTNTLIAEVASFLRMMDEYPVDCGIFYTQFLDQIGHCYGTRREWIAEGYHLADATIKALVDTLQPERWVVLSDHGMEPLPTPEVHQHPDGLWYVYHAAHSEGGFVGAGHDGWGLNGESIEVDQMLTRLADLYQGVQQ